MLFPISPADYLGRFGRTVLGLFLFVGLFILPYSLFWLYSSGDVALERVIERQAQGDFVIFGSGVSQDFVDYKLALYTKVKPKIVALGSSRVMQFRARYFRKSFLNMGGVAGNLPVLRSTLDAMLAVHVPEVVLLGLDFWWFMPKWNPDPFASEPPTSGSYRYTLASLKKPWARLIDGKVRPEDIFAPFFSFRDDRFGIMAQTTDDGFASDGSWYYTAETTGQKKPFDYAFLDTLKQVRYGIKAFYHAKPDEQAPSSRHLDAISEIYCRLKSRGVRVYCFIPPLAETVYTAMRAREAAYPHLFELASALKQRGIPVLDMSNPRTLGSNDCEFVDGFHGGEICYLRIIRNLCDQWSPLLGYVHVEAVTRAISLWKGHVAVHDPRVTSLWEQDFNDLGCRKHQKEPSR
ncbi:MAG: hypothetical protein IJU76_02045 [Desulfovibrionaceae bacterium]|nr:hypothetical protein [Desulfovibrionaceae bacterium]